MDITGEIMSTVFLSHRGESDDAPENTMSSFALAAERDSDGIELDVRLTADNQVVCCHDEDLLRVAGVPVKVAESTLDELRKYYPVPLLSEALSVIAGRGLMQIELKGDPALIPFVREVIDGFPGRNRLSISSFEQDTIAGAALAFPDLPRLLLIDLEEKFGTFPSADEVIELLAPLHCSISFKADFAADCDFVNTLHRAGLRVVGWGVATDELGLHLAGIGVDAMTCNHAVALREKYRNIQNR
jgi:glycerophosphoryl diester phosphodiesterase